MRFILGLLTLSVSVCAGELESIYLKVPTLSKETLIGTNVGVRPVRQSGIRIEKQIIESKTIIHNYGYGGSGLTVSWGGASNVAALVEKEPVKQVAILGAGVAGLTTAYELLELGYEVTIYSESWSPNLTSNVAAGIWSPPFIPADASDSQKSFLKQILEISAQRFAKSIEVESPEFKGIGMIDCYSFRNSGTAETAVGRKFGIANDKNQQPVTVHFSNGLTREGMRMREISIDGGVYIEDLFKKVVAKGAVLIEKQFAAVADVLALEESLIVNCTSLGSRELFGDEDFKPVRGQLAYFDRQELDYLYFENVPGESNYWVSLYPWNDRLILGGVYEAGKEELVNDPAVIDLIIEHANKSLSGAF